MSQTEGILPALETTRCVTLRRGASMSQTEGILPALETTRCVTLRRGASMSLRLD